MSYSGKNIVKNSVTLNEVTKATAEALPNRNGKLLNVDGDLYKDDGSKLVKVVNKDSKSTNWGLIYRGNHVVSDWTVTGDADVSDSTLDGSYPDSFRVDTGTAGNTATIEHVIPPSAIDVRYNQAVIEYQLFDITDPVTCKVLDWDNNIIGQVELTQTGSAPAVADNIRFSHATVDFSFPFSHGSLIRSVKFRFECASDINAGQFLVNFIQSDSNPRSIGQWVEVNNVSLSGNGGEVITANVTNIPFNGSGTGWDSVNDQYYPQRNGSTVTLDPTVNFTTSGNRALYVYVNNVLYKTIGITTSTFAITGSITLSGDIVRTDHPISFRIGLTSTLSDSSTMHGLNITESVNRRSIMSEGDIVNADETWFTANPDGTFADARFGIAGSGNTNDGLSLVKDATGQWTLDTSSLNCSVEQTFTGNVQDDSATVGQTLKIDPVTPTSATIKVINASGSLVDAKFSVKISKNYPDARNNEIKSIPVDEIIADGNEYAVFGKFITVGGVKYQVFRRSFEGTVGTKATGLPLTLKPVDNTWINQSTNNSFSNLIGVGTTNYVRVDYYYTGGSAGNLAVTQFGAYTGAGVHYYFDYYDTARPYYG